MWNYKLNWNGERKVRSNLSAMISYRQFIWIRIAITFNFFCPLDEPAYLGCFRDNLPRDLQVYIPTHPATIGACVDTCKSQGFSVGALRNSDLCFCGNAYRKSNQVADKECDMPCYDNSFEVCGGFMTFSQYWTGKTRKLFCIHLLPLFIT